MGSLRIHLSSPREDSYILQPAAFCRLSGELTVNNVSTIRRGSQARVLHGTLCMNSPRVANGNGGETIVLDVALKLVVSWYHKSRLQTEAEKYEQVKHLQGTAVPRVYGLYRGATPDGFVTCLVMDYVGPEAGPRFDRAPVDYNLQTLSKLIRLHDAGLTHGALREEHVVFPGLNYSPHPNSEPNGPFLISLSHARPHCCSRSLPIVESTLRPPPEDFGCEELWAAAARMGVWNPGEIDYFSSPVPLSRAQTPEQLAREAPLRMQSTAAGWAEALSHARRVLAAHQARYGPVELAAHDYGASEIINTSGELTVPG